MSQIEIDGFARQAAVREVLQHRKALQPILGDICDEARRRFDVPTAMINLIDESYQVTIAGSGPTLDVVPRQVSFCDTAIKSDAALVVADAATHPMFQNNSLVTGPPHIRFYAGIPLVFMSKIRLGALCICDQRPREFSLGDIAELEELAGQVINQISLAEFPPS